MNLTQPDLFDRAPARNRATEDARLLIRHLTQAAAPVTGRQLRRDLGWDERRIRDAANASLGHIASAPGKPGYALLTALPVEDARETINRLRSQHAAMAARIRQLESVFHSSGNAPLP